MLKCIESREKIYLQIFLKFVLPNVENQNCAVFAFIEVFRWWVLTESFGFRPDERNHSRKCVLLIKLNGGSFQANQAERFIDRWPNSE